MAAATNPLLCDECGVPMNHHADKVDFRVPESEPIDPHTGGVMVEFHSCPRCGRTQSRLAAENHS